MPTRQPPEDETIRMPSGSGARREREYGPRTELTQAEVVEALERSLRVLMTSASHPRVAYDGLRQAWFPALRQAVEQLGGDGIDSWLTSLLQPPGRLPADPFFSDLVTALQHMRGARDVAQLEEEALKAIELVRRVGRAGPPRRLSVQVLEGELEGALDLEALLTMAAAAPDDLRRRLGEIDSSMQVLRDQLTRAPGHPPEGLAGRFARLKAELRVLDGELRRRSAVATDLTPVV
jgi:hypothetical protein